jgi:DNA-binding transcriptional LysR family regulator
MVKQSWGYTTFPSDMTESLKELELVPLDIDEGFEAKEVGLYYLSEQAGNPIVRDLVARISASAAAYAQKRQSR